MKMKMKTITHLAVKAKHHIDPKVRREKCLSDDLGETVDHIYSIEPRLLNSSNRLGGPGSRVYAINRQTVAKVGANVRMAEADAMRFIKAHTSIPVPAVLESYVIDMTSSNPRGCIVMERVQGESLDKVWHTYTQEMKRKVASQLRVIFDELRTFEGHQISSVDGTFCNDVFFTSAPSLAACGPFASHESFCDGIATALRNKRDDAKTEMLIRFIKSIRPGRILLTHNEFVPRNIMVDDGQVVAVLDWEKAGFFPEYWEYVKALFWPDWNSPWSMDGVVDVVLQPYIIELGLLLHAKQAI